MISVKRGFSYWIVLGLLMVIGLGASAQSRTAITAYTGSPGGLYMEPFIVWSELWRELDPPVIASVIHGGSNSNPIAVSRATPGAAVGVTTTILAHEAWNGIGEYADISPEGIRELRALWRFNVLSYGHVLFRDNVLPSGVATLGDLLKANVRLRFDVKERGSGAEAAANRLFESYGLSYQDLQKMGWNLTFSAPSDATSLMIDGHLDGMFNVARVPASVVLDLEASVPGLVWLPIDQENLQYLYEKHGYLIEDHPDSYSSIDAPFPTLAYDHVVFVHEGMSEELAYRLTKAVLENPEVVHNAVPAMKPFDPQVAGTNTIIPLHPGAERAYKELGFLD